MPKLWLVARHEYAAAVKRRTFVLATLGMPAFLVLIMSFSILVATSRMDRRPVGYVDQANVVSPLPDLAGWRESVPLRAFPDETTARAALAARSIQAFYVVPAGYRQSGQVTLYYGERPLGGGAQATFDAALRAGLLAGQPADVQARVTGGIDLALRSADGRREISQENLINFFLPFIAGLVFSFSTLNSAGYLVQAVATEKENRMVEVMATSMTPLQLIGGKAIGLMAVALTQLGVWLAIAMAGVVLAAQLSPALRAVEVPWGFLLLGLLFFLASYALIAGMMTAIGAVVTEVHQAQQIAGTVNLMFVFPYFLLPLLFVDPNSPLFVALTLFPTTAFITITMRWAFTIVPTWQMALSWVILVGTAGFSLWAAARIFRAGMLRYGQPLDLRDTIRILSRRSHA
jgi:ABC-2 type transport system permease protein